MESINNKEAKIKITAHVDPEVLKKIDEIRGSLSRSAFINDSLYWGYVATDEQIQQCDV